MGKYNKYNKNIKEKNFLKTLNSEEALALLHILAKDEVIRLKIEKVAKEYLSKIDIQELAGEVYINLNSLDVTELWDNSGPTTYGYEDPNDMAWEMFEEVLSPYIEQLKKYKKLKMDLQAKQYCIGLLQGIKNYQKKSKSKFKDWATDADTDAMDNIFDIWKKGVKSSEAIKEVEKIYRD